jgi:biopolymer transport protein ExbB
MLGLLGTVLGMMDTFAVLEQAGAGDPKVLAGGINRALYTTAMGISIAVPVFLTHRWLENATLDRIDDVEALFDILVEDRGQNN